MSARSCIINNNEIPDDVSVRKKLIHIKLVWIFFIAAILQIVPFVVLAPESLIEVKKTLLISSYLLLCWGLICNRHYWSVRIILFGVLLNFAAIVANGGLMPVSPEAISLAGMSELGDNWLGKVTPHGTGILLTVDQTNLWVFTDIFPVQKISAVLSVGDLLLGAGLVFFVLELFRKE